MKPYQEEEKKEEPKLPIYKEIKPITKPKPRNPNQPLEYTHFISIPLNDPQIISKLKKFKANIVKTNKDLKKFFVDFKKIHLTICMLSLPT